VYWAAGIRWLPEGREKWVEPRVAAQEWRNLSTPESECVRYNRTTNGHLSTGNAPAVNTSGTLWSLAHDKEMEPPGVFICLISIFLNFA